MREYLAELGDAVLGLIRTLTLESEVRVGAMRVRTIADAAQAVATFAPVESYTFLTEEHRVLARKAANHVFDRLKDVIT